ncbi:LPS export ABC transporter ATP-binding protein [SAR86 cluster bacterium]|nr:LPS export ABC transporter ATP-binding protein [SAR86 cluster bacterium]
MNLKTINLKKKYGQKTILKGINANINMNSITGLLGPNGAGKTTFFYILAGLLNPSNGDIFIDDELITHKTIRERSRSGLVYLPQEPSIFRELSVYQNIKSALEMQNLEKSNLKIKIDEILKEFDITHLAKQKGKSLSGGQRRRVEIARSIALNPKFIMLDEPFAGIDPIAIQDLKILINKLSIQGLGILISDHNVKATMDICEEIFIINEGRIISSGSPDEVSKNDVVKKVYLGDS